MRALAGHVSAGRTSAGRTSPVRPSAWRSSVRLTSAVPLNLDGHLFTRQSGKAIEVRTRLAADFTGWETDNANFETQFERLIRAGRGGANLPGAAITKSLVGQHSASRMRGSQRRLRCGEPCRPDGHWKARPDAIGHEQGTEMLRWHSDRRMRFIHEVDVALFGVEAHAGRSERGQANGLCPLQGADGQRRTNSISRLSLMPIGWLPGSWLRQPSAAAGQ